MNHIRRANPALQTHLGVHFHSAQNDNILFFSKSTAENDNVVLVAISLDPHSPQSATLEVPFWELGLPDDGTVRADDLLHGYTYWWHGKIQHVDLSPAEPYRVWRLSRS
jgi:starch synthase (maltosyl-transferring)